MLSRKQRQLAESYLTDSDILELEIDVAEWKYEEDEFYDDLEYIEINVQPSTYVNYDVSYKSDEKHFDKIRYYEVDLGNVGYYEGVDDY